MKKNVMQALDYALRKGFQVHPNAVRMLQDTHVDSPDKIIRDVVREKSIDRNYHISREDLARYLGLDVDESISCEHKILSDCSPRITTPAGMEGYVALFKSRFEKMRKIMQDRPEASKVRSISAVKSKTDGALYVCGLVTGKRVEGAVSRLTIEDDTGSMEGLVFEDLKGTLEKIFLDQFVMVKVDNRNNIIFSEIIFPDIPSHRVNRSESEVYAALLSDLHVGSKYFMEKEFRRFLGWLSGPDPIARRIRYVVIAGDIVDGVGIFPGQDRELTHTTIREQFEKTDELLSEIPGSIEVFIIPGNHDPGRRALPQPAVPQEDSRGLWSRRNVHMLGNPSMVSLNGVRVLVFHGQSIDDIVKTTAGMEYAHPANAMKQILKSRHLSPIYGSQTPIAPCDEDLMVIDDVPDVFHAGHVHVVEMDTYKDVLVVNSGAWQSQTPFQLSVGQVPVPAVAVMLNLKTFKVYLKSFRHA